MPAVDRFIRKIHTQGMYDKLRALDVAGYRFCVTMADVLGHEHNLNLSARAAVERALVLTMLQGKGVVC